MPNSVPYHSFVASFLIFGFYFSSSFFEFLTITSSYPNYLYRFIVVCLSLAIFLRTDFNKCQFNVLLYIIFIFMFYLVAMLKGEYLLGHNYSQPLSYSIPFLFFVVLIPLVVFFKPQSINDLYFIRFSIFFIALTFLFLASSYNKLLLTDYITSSRFYTEKVNPIAIGHLAVSLFFLSLIYFKKYNLHSTIFLILTFSSLVVLLLTQSRGAFVSFLMVLFYYIIKSGGIKNIKFILFIVFVFVALLVTAFFYGVDNYFDAFLKIGSSDDLSAVSRFTSYSGALNAIDEFPLLGSGVEEPITKYYPHNVILEIIMAVGILGFSLFVLPVLISLIVISIRKLSIFSMLYIQYLTAAMFSGAVWNSYILWYLLAYTLCAACKNNISFKKVFYVN